MSIDTVSENQPVFRQGVNRIRTIPSKRSRGRLQYRQRRQVRSIAKQVLLGQQEKKYFDTDVQVSPSSTYILQDLSNIPQGDTDVSRDGDKIMIKSLHLRGLIAVGDTTNFVRIIVYQWHPSDVTLSPTANLVLSDLTSPLNTPYNHDNGKMYSIFYDRLIALGSNSQQTVAIEKIWRFGNKLDRRLKWVNQSIDYVAGTTGGSDKLFLLIVSDSGGIPHPAAELFFRLIYTDS